MVEFIQNSYIQTSNLLNRLSKLVAATFLVEMVISWKLWIPVNREFPLISAFSWLDFSLGVIGDVILTLGLVIALIHLFFRRHNRLAMIILSVSIGILILEDINRLQPWVYSQTGILFMLTKSKKSENSIISGILLILALVYMWTGFQKFNLGFMLETFPWLLSGINVSFATTAEQTLGAFHYLGILAPIVEISIGLLLFKSQTRKIGIIFGIGMHLFILLCIGPTGHSWNMVAWPWNISLIIILLVFLGLKKGTNLKIELRQHSVAVIVFGILPLFNFFGYWDNALSGSLYTGTESMVSYYYPIGLEPKLEQYKGNRTTPLENNQDPLNNRIYFMIWSMSDINVPYYQADRYFKRMAIKVCKQSKKPDASGIIITTREKFTAKRTINICSCRELLSSDQIVIQ